MKTDYSKTYSELFDCGPAIVKLGSDIEHDDIISFEKITLYTCVADNMKKTIPGVKLKMWSMEHDTYSTLSLTSDEAIDIANDMLLFAAEQMPKEGGEE